MDNDQLDRTIDDLERALQREDPSLAKRFARLERADRRNDVTVFSLLFLSAALLAVALATLSGAAAAAGVAAYLGSFLVDHLHHRRLAGRADDRRRRPTDHDRPRRRPLV